MHDNLLHLMDICFRYPSRSTSFHIYTELFMYDEECFCFYIYQTKEWLMSCRFKKEPHAICIYGNDEGFEISSSYYDRDSQGSTLSHFVSKEDLEKYLDHLLVSYTEHL